MKNELFDKNVSLWSHTNARAAVMVSYVDSSSLQFCKTAVNEPNLKTVKGGITNYYHAQEGAKEECQRWFSQLQLESIDVLYVFGVGLGYIYDATKAWLDADPKHHLVFLEDDLRVFHRLFETERATLILQDPKVSLIYFESMQEQDSALHNLYWDYLTTKMLVAGSPYYMRERLQECVELQYRLVHDCTLRQSLLQEYLDHGVAYYRNLYPNLLCLPGASLGDNLIGAFKGIPAVICGAGFSLNKHLHLFNEIENKALIFAGGSALNVLNSAGFQPHLGAGIDPNPEQFKRLSTNIAFEVPFLYRNRMDHRAFTMIHGPHLYITGSGGYDTAKWFEEQLEIQGEPIEEGYNVVNFCLDVAKLWGCDPVIFVGMDLAFTEMQAYASGVVGEASVKEKELIEKDDLEARGFLKPDIFGTPVYTLWKWVSESEWITAFAKRNPEMTLINATEGGIGFQDVPNVALQEVIEQRLRREYDLRSRLQGEIQSNIIQQVTPERILNLMHQLKDSLRRSIGHITTLMDDAEKVAGQMEKTKSVVSAMQSGLAALAETELADEDAYKAILSTFNYVYSKVLYRDLKEIYQSRKQLEDWQQAVLKLRVSNKKLAFLRDVAETQLKLISSVLTKRR